MESNFDENRGNWQDDLSRCDGMSTDLTMLENPERVLSDCLSKFKTADYIMEPGIFLQLKRYFIFQLL